MTATLKYPGPALWHCFRLCLLAVLLSGFHLSPAMARRPATVELSQSVGQPGEQLQVSGKRFGRLKYGQLFLDGEQVASFLTSVSGRFQTDFSIPDGIAPGDKTLIAVTQRASVSAEFEVITASQYLLREDFESFSPGPWQEGQIHGDWQVVYDGYGEVRISDEDSQLLELSPASAQEFWETHGALVTSVASFSDLDLRLRMRSVEQLRAAEPNPWEVAWLLWHYQSNQQFYYLALKPNGWELGKADPAYPGAQRFLATGNFPQYPLGYWNRLRVKQIGATIQIWADDELLTIFTDEEQPYLEGSIGLYSEDATVQFDDIEVSLPE